MLQVSQLRESRENQAKARVAQTVSPIKSNYRDMMRQALFS